MNRAKVLILRGAVIGLTFISVTAGFDFYHSLFDLTTALLCCVIFETTRLACLWSLVDLGWLRNLIAIPVYIIVALTCAFAGITSFHARIIESHTQAKRPLEKEMAKRTEIIRRTYTQKASEQLQVLDGKIDVCNRKLAWSPTSSYWKNRRTQLIAERKELVTRRGHFLSEVPQEGRRLWISHHASLLGVALEPLPLTISGSAATTQAIQELWGVTELHAKKITSIIIVLTIELGIILLTLLTKRDPKVESATQSEIQLINQLNQRFDESEIERFLTKCQDSFNKHGRLPFSRELGKRQREIKKVVSEMQLDSQLEPETTFK